jgi:hypothetical protein
MQRQRFTLMQAAQRIGRSWVSTKRAADRLQLGERNAYGAREFTQADIDALIEYRQARQPGKR